jgi:hypothetical protein
LSLADSDVIGKSKNRRRTADGFLIFLLCLQIVFKFNKSLCFKEINRKCLKYVKTWWVLDQGGFLVSYWLETRREMHPWGLHFCLGISPSVSAILQALLDRSPTSLCLSQIVANTL